MASFTGAQSVGPCLRTWETAAVMTSVERHFRVVQETRECVARCASSAFMSLRGTLVLWNKRGNRVACTNAIRI